MTRAFSFLVDALRERLGVALGQIGVAYKINDLTASDDPLAG